MPRGKRKRGAFDCQIWFEDGARFRLTSHGDRVQSNAEIAAAIRKNLLPLLDAAAAPHERDEPKP